MAVPQFSLSPVPGPNTAVDNRGEQNEPQHSTSPPPVPDLDAMVHNESELGELQCDASLSPVPIPTCCSRKTQYSSLKVPYEDLVTDQVWTEFIAKFGAHLEKNVC